ncbi:MAG: binding-protein-dependent transport permease [Ruminococcaceae bacterium]|nr:binding-protein-dependent transport permease [Oscillospiraceae bacterium]
MGRAILASFVTLVVGLLTMSIFTGAFEVGIVVAIAVMGAFIIYFNEKKK